MPGTVRGFVVLYVKRPSNKHFRCNGQRHGPYDTPSEVPPSGPQSCTGLLKLDLKLIDPTHDEVVSNESSVPKIPHEGSDYKFRFNIE